MSAPRTKRQFAGAASDPAQRQITSFFSRHTAGQDDSLTGEQQHQTSSRPALPAMVQSNLLSVGMRVRKSVAEGHKNGVGCDFSMWSGGYAQKPRVLHQHQHQHQPHQTTSSTATTAPAPHPQSSSFDPRSSSYVPLPGTSATRELLPFCGIHNVGGMSAQPDFDPAPALPLPTTAFAGLASVPPDVNDVPGLSRSQGSVGSMMANSSSRKRTYDSNSDDDSADESSHQLPAARLFAEPRSRRSRDHPFSAATQLPPKGGCAVAVASNDFPEADFLDYRQFSPDMDMGGV
ncbi:hypothetical protein MAPG_02042 [Magnaporthiopsis poae ATCC 64411]|uniref:Uncharacterized protein n=1 Tax=Magnaporthiopsis poae (strain ATCC 64411 / 73-15) TaxID=644358 RepID=A0A0C4DQA4_MAGP6|nr:hypothetical protein MAPG_02042 [Magnaporthiopsis poae ATCC 64411]